MDKHQPLVPISESQLADVVRQYGETFYFAAPAEIEIQAVGIRRPCALQGGGMLYLSDRRLLFLGVVLRESIPLGRWERAEEEDDVIELHCSDRLIIVHASDPTAGFVLRQLLKELDAGTTASDRGRLHGVHANTIRLW